MTVRTYVQWYVQYTGRYSSTMVRTRGMPYRYVLEYHGTRVRTNGTRVLEEQTVHVYGEIVPWYYG